ncbi:hypothetical protein Ccrd_010606 [Cynara cardunculus var. scolymus]|uniref:Uncharacterized protein n=1 Tax=Cynara cardunculus var. scolymus TaxID=59895 RepID=A0A118K6P7_CYNCS|nr:hypothetical protein Ccrd_010606 [Cynara cardunculus var. scolymus]
MDVEEGERERERAQRETAPLMEEPSRVELPWSTKTRKMCFTSFSRTLAMGVERGERAQRKTGVRVTSL